jgi:hypothetical protein
MSESPRPRWLIPLLFGATGLLALPLITPVARACGMFYHHRALAPEQRPSLAREKVLIIHDAAHGQQHFIREVAFRKAEQTLGFVVPTPTRPEVAAVAQTPFTKLRERFPFASPPRDAIGSAPGYGRGGGGSPRGVEVLAVEKVGSFTAFTLTATDADALAGWLHDNQLSSTPENDRWLDHYVRMGFYYVALRYDPPAKTKPDALTGIAAETVRISFATPIAYYPYLEPAREQIGAEPRLLELWYVGSDPVVPVARFDERGEPSQPPTWTRPMKPGKDYRRTREQVAAAFDAELDSLLPPGDLVVQTFQDQKRDRSGHQDILFAFAEPKPLTAEELAALEPLLGVLDPLLIPEDR